MAREQQNLNNEQTNYGALAQEDAPEALPPIPEYWGEQFIREHPATTVATSAVIGGCATGAAALWEAQAVLSSTQVAGTTCTSTTSSACTVVNNVALKCTEAAIRKGTETAARKGVEVVVRKAADTAAGKVAEAVAGKVAAEATAAEGAKTVATTKAVAVTKAATVTKAAAATKVAAGAKAAGAVTASKATIYAAWAAAGTYTILGLAAAGTAVGGLVGYLIHKACESREERRDLQKSLSHRDRFIDSLVARGDLVVATPVLNVDAGRIEPEEMKEGWQEQEQARRHLNNEPLQR